MRLHRTVFFRELRRGILDNPVGVIEMRLAVSSVR